MTQTGARLDRGLKNTVTHGSGASGMSLEALPARALPAEKAWPARWLLDGDGSMTQILHPAGLVGAPGSLSPAPVTI